MIMSLLFSLVLITFLFSPILSILSELTLLSGQGSLSLSLNELLTFFPPTFRHQTSFFLEHLLDKTFDFKFNYVPLRCKQFLSLLPILKPRNVFLKDLEAIFKM